MADGDTPREIRVAGQHDYTSTACLHGACGSCRRACKFCSAPCRCGCHGEAGPHLVAQVDQARDIARQMYAVLPVRYMPVELFRQIQEDPGLFWLRGGEPPPGEVTRDAGPV